MANKHIEEQPDVTGTIEDSKVIWQKAKPDEGIGEPALLIDFYSDCIAITQAESQININYGTVRELCKIMTAGAKEQGY